MIENQIRTFMHCAKCLSELPAGTSPREFAALEVGITPDKRVQVWCKRHELNVVVIGPETLEHLDGCSCAMCARK